MRDDTINTGQNQADGSPLTTGGLVLKRLVGTVIVLAVLGCSTLFAVFAYANLFNPRWNDFIFQHFAALICMPAAAAGAFIVCALYRTAEGKIVFKIAGLSFEGAAGPIVMWVLCFLSMVAALRWLWPLGM